MKKIILLWLLCWTLCVTLNAQPATTPHSAKVICRFEGSKDGDTARVEIWKYNIKTPEIRRQSLAIIKNSQVEVMMDSLNYPVYLSVFYKQKTLRNRELYFANPELYLVEPGDSIHINCTKTSMVFSGRGAARMQVWDQMGKLKNRILKNYPDRISKDYRNKLYDFYDESLTTKMAFLKTYQKRISRIAYQLLQADAFAVNMLARLPYFELKNIIRDSGTTVEDYGALYLRFSSIRTPFPINEKDAILAHSFYYTNLLMRRHMTDSFRMMGKPFNVMDCYEQIKRKYTGILRDNLLTCLIERHKASDNVLNCFQDALLTVKDPELKEVLHKLYQNNRKGNIVFDFSLRDTTNKLVRLSDFKNKIVLLDIWFTGCIPCMSTSKALEAVETLFKENKDMVFIGISTDRDKAVWLKSVRKGWYSSPFRINLFTDQKGEIDPFIQYYDIHTYPTLMLVDRKGNLYSGALPNPLSDKGQGIISVINKALAQ